MDEDEVLVALVVAAVVVVEVEEDVAASKGEGSNSIGSRRRLLSVTV